jgi:hypothetical protein
MEGPGLPIVGSGSAGPKFIRKVWQHAIGSSNVRPMVDRYPQRGQRLDEFAALDPFEYERQRKIAAKQLSVRPPVVDAIRAGIHRT